MVLLNIIIPNCNGSSFLPSCLDSILKQTFTNYTITVVDNGSSDNSLALLHSRYPEINAIALAENMGFAEACNMGIRSQSTPYVMLLNNDTVLMPDCIEKMMETIQISPSIFSVGPTILTMEKDPLVDTIGDYYSLFGYAFCHQQGLAPTPHATHEVFTNSACASIYRTQPLLQFGLLDSTFFAYLEDVDLGMRSRLQGLKNIHCASAMLYHFGSGTTTKKERYSPFKVYYSARNNQLLRAKNLSLLQRFLHSPFVLAGFILKFLYFRRIQLHSEYICGTLDGLRISRAYRNPASPSVLSFLKIEAWIWYGSYLFVKQFLKRKTTKLLSSSSQ